MTLHNGVSDVESNESDESDESVGLSRWQTDTDTHKPITDTT